MFGLTLVLNANSDPIALQEHLLGLDNIFEYQMDDRDPITVTPINGVSTVFRHAFYPSRAHRTNPYYMVDVRPTFFERLTGARPDKIELVTNIENLNALMKFFDEISLWGRDNHGVLFATVGTEMDGCISPSSFVEPGMQPCTEGIYWLSSIAKLLGIDRPTVGYFFTLVKPF